MIAFACAQCGMKYEVKDEFASRTTRCTACKASMTVPAAVPVATVCAPNVVAATVSHAPAGFGVGVTLSVKSNDTDDTGQPANIKDILDRHGQTGDRYVDETEIARGGMGKVVRAVDCQIRREVALKFLLDQSSETKRLRFIEEAQITGQLEHPNIVPVHELGVDGQQRVFFSMKMVRGRSLAQILEELRAGTPQVKKTYTLGKLLNILVNVCNALAYAHSLGVVHRDLKPANIMVGDFGEVYVMDWGLAKLFDVNAPDQPLDHGSQFALAMGQPGAAVDGSGSSLGRVVTSRDLDTELTSEGTVLGTPVYMPPEQAAGRLKEIGPCSDIYSLGAILYEMLTWKAPVDRTGGFQEIIKRVVTGAILHPDERSPERARAGAMPKELSAVAIKALAKNPADRYASVEALRRDIELFQEGRSVSAKEDSRRELFIKLVKRNQALTIATTAAAAAIALILVAGSWINFRAARAAQKAYDDRIAAESDTAERTRKAVPALVESAQLSLDRRRYENALSQVKLALDYNPEHADALLLHGQILMAFKKDYAGARWAFEGYLKQRPGDKMARDLHQRCGREDPEDATNLLMVAEKLVQQNVPTLAERVLMNYGENPALARDFLLKMYRKRIDEAWDGYGNYLTFDPEGQFFLNLGHAGRVTGLAPLEGMPLTKLSLESCKDVYDLSPLKGMPLGTLNIGNTSVSNLSALAGMPLTHLSATNTKIKDLSPLRNLPLTYLGLYGCSAVSDLTPLKGMPLEYLNLRSSSVHDVKPLEGMPLTYLNLYSCRELTNLGPLKGMKLRSLDISSSKVTDLGPLRGMPLEGLALSDCRQLRDLSPLKGMPLRSIGLTNCNQIQDIAALKGMNLTSLSLVSCGHVRDLAPLIGMPLTELSLQNCGSVEDLTPLKDLPLSHLDLNTCPRIRDVSPLKDLKLASINLPAQKVHGLEHLRNMKTLVRINGVPAADFWKKLDSKS